MGVFSLLTNNEQLDFINVDSCSYSFDYSDIDSNFNSHNCKIIHYPDGYKCIKYCDHNVFVIPKKHRESLMNYFGTPFEDKPSERSHITIADSSLPRCRLDNIERSRQRIFDIAMLNDFKYFFTGTVKTTDSIDRENAESLLKPVLAFLNNMVKRKGLIYLFVPELHHVSNGIHFHALVNDTFQLVDSFTRIVNGFDKPVLLSSFERLGLTSADVKSVVYNCPEWTFGFSTAIPLYGSRFHLANYMVKYVCKNILLDNSKITSHRYYFSRKNTVIYPKFQFKDISGNEFQQIDSDVYFQQMSNKTYKYESNLTYSVEGD